jgi:hypothetical protein
MSKYERIHKAVQDMEHREREERAALLKEHNKKYSKERAVIKKLCEEIGHERGKYWDNGLGWEWYYCCHCSAVMDENCYTD